MVGSDAVKTSFRGIRYYSQLEAACVEVQEDGSLRANFLSNGDLPAEALRKADQVASKCTACPPPARGYCSIR
jgi:hypothetical protein